MTLTYVENVGPTQFFLRQFLRRGRSDMAPYLVGVNFQPGVIDTPMEEWKPRRSTRTSITTEAAVNEESRPAGSSCRPRFSPRLTSPKIVTSYGTAPVVTDGPLQEFKERVAGYQIDVEPKERALEIAVGSP